MASLQDVCWDDRLHAKQACIFLNGLIVIKLIKPTPELNEACQSDRRYIDGSYGVKKKVRISY